MRLAALALLLLSGCVKSSIKSDVARIEALAELPGVEALVAYAVDPLASEDAREILASPLDADAAVRVALLNNRELRAKLRELGIVRGQLLQAGLLPNPRAEFEFLPERNTRFSFRVEMDVTRTLLAARRRRALSPELEGARHAAAASVVELGYRVRAAFYRLESATERLGVAERSLDALAAARDAARAIFEAGGAARLDLATQEAAYERARVQVAELTLAAESDRERLARLLGVFGPEANLAISSALPEVPAELDLLDDLEEKALASSLAMLSLKHRAESLARRVGVTRLEGSLPELVADIHGLVGNPRVDEPQHKDLRVSGGVTVGIPIFDRNQGLAASLLAELSATTERYYGLAVDVRSAARDARNHLISAHRRARHYQEVIAPAQKRVTEETLLQYNAMQLGIFQLLAAHREELTVAHALIEARREFWTALAAVEALLAGASVTLED